MTPPTNPGDPTTEARETGAILRRDAARTDVVVIPLIAGALAPLAIATADAEQHEPPDDEAVRAMREAAAWVAGLARDADDATWRDDLTYFRLYDFVLTDWAITELWLPSGFRAHELEAAKGAGRATVTDMALAWIRKNPTAPLVDTVLLAGYAAEHAPPDVGECALMERPGRKLRVELANRLRKLPDPSWGGILRAVAAEWDAGAMGRLAYQIAQAAAIANQLLEEGEAGASASDAERQASPDGSILDDMLGDAGDDDDDDPREGRA